MKTVPAISTDPSMRPAPPRTPEPQLSDAFAPQRATVAQLARLARRARRHLTVGQTAPIGSRMLNTPMALTSM